MLLQRLIITSFSLFMMSNVLAQLPNLIVEGKVKIDGERLEFSDNPKGHILIGHNVGANLDPTLISADNANIGIGYEALRDHIAYGGNTAIGHLALSKDLESANNTAIGYEAMKEHISGGNNLALGYRAMAQDSAGQFNTAIGNSTLSVNISGRSNTAVGHSALLSNKEGFFNVSLGRDALYRNLTGNHNVAVGAFALRDNEVGHNNIGIGYKAFYNGDIGEQNIGIGTEVLNQNVGSYNIASGYQAMYKNSQGNNNVAIGPQTLFHNHTGNGNIAIGLHALFYNYTGINNTAIGHFAFNTGEFFSNSTAIGHFSRPMASNQIRLGNASITSIGGFEGWSNFSDQRLKKNIKKDIPGLEFITQLRPVSYQLDMDNIAKWQNMPDSLRDFKSEEIKGNIRYSGFLAQEVEEAAKEIDYEFSGIDSPKNDGDRYGLRYSQFVVPLVKAVQELEEENQQLRKELEDNNKELKAENEVIKKELAELKALIMNEKQTQSIHLSADNKEKAILSQNVPNPFNDNTTIRYFIPESYSTAILQIVNQDGKMIKKVSIQESGAGQIQINAAELNNGNYFYSLILDGQLVESKQMVKIKN